MDSLIRDIIACFDGVLPERTLALVDWPLSQRLIEDYKLNPVLCFGADRAPRIGYSGQGEGDTTVMTRHTTPPLDLLPAPFRQRVQGLLDLGATGLWGVRKRGSQVIADGSFDVTVGVLMGAKA